MGHHTQFIRYWSSSSGPCACQQTSQLSFSPAVDTGFVFRTYKGLEEPLIRSSDAPEGTDLPEALKELHTLLRQMHLILQRSSRDTQSL